MKDNRGFTLVEVLVAVSIMALITIIAFPSIRQFQASNAKKKFETYELTAITSAKLYADSYQEDLFGYNYSGCVEIRFWQLENANLLKKYAESNISCISEDSNADSFVYVNKTGEKFSYFVNMKCFNEKGMEVYSTPADEIKRCDSSGGDGGSLSVTFGGIGNKYTKEKTVNVKIKDSDGLLENTKITYCLYKKDQAGNCIDSGSYNFKNQRGKQEVSFDYKTPKNLTGTYILKIGTGNIRDIYGNGLAEDKDSSDIKLDNTVPTKVQITNPYENKWINKDYNVKAASSDATSEIAYFEYRYTNSPDAAEKQWKKIGNKGDTEVSIKQSKERNVTLEVRAYDEAGNASASSTTIIKLDKTAPAKVQITNSHENAWTGTPYSVVCKSHDAVSGISYYQYRYPNSTVASEKNWANYASSAMDTFTTPKFSKIGDQTVQIRACDKAGNCSEVGQSRIKIAQVFNVTLNSAGASSVGTSKVYLARNVGVFLDSALKKKMTGSANKITIPVRSGYIFQGYYTAQNGGGTQLINANGFITGSFTNTVFNANTTLYAKWKSAVIKFSDINDNHKCQNEVKGSEGTFLFTYTGACKVVQDGGDNYKVYLYGDQTSRSGVGTLRFSADLKLDFFLVGGGGASGKNWGGGGGGGYTNTFANIQVAANTNYTVQVGAGGAAGSCSNTPKSCDYGRGNYGQPTYVNIGTKYSVNGGQGGSCGNGRGWGQGRACSNSSDAVYGGSGGSGGGYGWTNMYCADLLYGASKGNSASYASGQGFSTCEWATSSDKKGTCPSKIEYSKGGNGGCYGGSNGAANTGNGATAAGNTNGSSWSGGSGVIVFRNKR